MAAKLMPASKEAMQLLMEGSVAFSRIEAAGLRIDVPYLEKSIKEVKAQIESLTDGLKGSREYKAWTKHFGNDTNLESRPQLGKVIFDILGHPRNPFIKDRETKRDRNNMAAFEHLKLPFVRDYQTVRRLTKALSTYLHGIQREVVDGYVHPFQSLAGGPMSGQGGGGAESYRSSSSRPNFHNMPVRNKEVSKIIRSCVIPRPGNVFIEVDYNSAEVRVSYCYNKDPVLKRDILTGDMHRDRAYEVYMLKPSEMGPVDKGDGKLIRYVVKNRFVFAEFYGSYYPQRAPELWDAISIFDLKRSDGVSLFDHLKSKGIKALGKCDPELEPIKGTFEYHIKEVERKMWQDTYTVYDQWKRDWWNLYQRQGGINTLTGFRMDGVFKKNQILCDPIQGSSFHCLLWSIIQTQKQLLRKKMKTKIVDQVHDSTLLDCPEKEVDDVIPLVKKIMTKDVAAHWPWIIVPLSVEFERSDTNWFDKKPLEEA